MGLPGRLGFAFALLLMAQEAQAQSGCLSSLNVDPKKSLTLFGWLPDGNGTGVSSMSCLAAERMRTRIFVDYLQASQDTVFGSPSQYNSELTARRNSLLQKRDELKTKLGDGSTRAAVVAVSKVAWYETVKFFTILACVAPEPTGLTKAGCVVGVIDVIKTTVGLGDDLTDADIRQQLSLIEKNLADLEPVYKAALQNNNQAKVNTAKAKFTSAFNGLCQAIKQQCLLP
ncbi:hypothetical protein ABIF66_000037 [Bradyrhizobium japonicum]|uniref:hypothetical protein n=1 Tax=Bradyrhizobium liaoningense TaxID=43992 RepID=UPI001BA84387|nr:hypothetical protein [Bradyrhizobium liaoningense]MBR1069422.1 hypothetical protein [Bradyrhizobium liaoningense]